MTSSSLDVVARSGSQSLCPVRDWPPADGNGSWTPGGSEWLIH